MPANEHGRRTEEHSSAEALAGRSELPALSDHNLLARIPAELRAPPQWVVWKLTERDGKPTKVPYRAGGGGQAKSDDPSTWSTFEDALAWLSQYPDRYAGLGFVFAEGDPYAGVDLDDCIDPATGELHPEAARIVATFPGAYVERSPSGTGVKLWIRATKSGKRCRTSSTPWSGEAELYDSRRYFAVTGDALGAVVPAEIADGQAALDALYGELFEPSSTDELSPEDFELVELAKSARNGERFAALWSGDTSGYPSESEADAALCSMLAFWAGPDGAERVARLFRASGLGKRSKAERGDYVERTIELAYRGRTDFYSGGRETPTPTESPSEYTLVNLGGLRPLRVRWHLDGLLPTALHTVLAAPGGTGKGLFELWAVAKHIPGTVLYFGTEDDFSMIVSPRALALGMDVERFVPIFKHDAEGELYSFRFPSDRKLLERALDETHATAIILDSGVEHLDDGLAANKAEDVRRFTNMLNHVARDRGVLPLDILHTNKNRDARGVERVGHSKVWTDASRHVLMMAPDDEDEDVRHVEVFKTNVGKRGYGRRFRILTRDVRVWDAESGLWVEEPIPYLVDDGESDKSVEDLLGVKPNGREGELDIDGAMLGYLVTLSEPVGSKHLDAVVAESTGCSPRTVANHRFALGKRGLVRAIPSTDDKGRVTGWSVEATPDGFREYHGAEEE